jgi:cation:H+ antiporter
MIDLHLPLWADILVFLGAAGAIGLFGVKLARYADQLADKTGMGEAITGTVLLGLLTALPGLVASVVAAIDGHAAMAISNAMGGIAFQTVALVVADAAYRGTNLEHAAASVPNMVQTGMLILLLTLVVGGLAGPRVTLGHISPMTLLLFAAAGFAFWIVFRTQGEPMWSPKQTGQTVEDVPDEEHQQASATWMIVGILVAGIVTIVSGALVAETAGEFTEEGGLAESVVGGLFMAIATSLPELVTSVAAVRRGAVTLAVSDIVGGNFFDVCFVAAADLAYLRGSLYHAEGTGDREQFLTALTILLNVVLLLGLLFRQRQGPGNIGLESVAMLLIYIGGFLVLSLAF